MLVELRQDTHAPKKWTGVLRRNLLAKSIQGSNRIEGYDVNEDDAIAAVEDDEPQDADAQTWVEILGYRAAMSYVLTAFLMLLSIAVFWLFRERKA